MVFITLASLGKEQCLLGFSSDVMPLVMAQAAGLHGSELSSCLFLLVTQSYLTLCDPMDCSTPGFPVLHCLPELLKLMSIESVMSFNHLILCCPLSSCLQSSQHQGLFQWVGLLHQVAEVLELQFQHQDFHSFSSKEQVCFSLLAAITIHSDFRAQII